MRARTVACGGTSLNIAQANHQIDDSITEAEQLEAELMDFITPTPTIINQKFMDYYQEFHEKQRIILSVM